MTVTCPNGHQSADPEWCDTCGARLGAAPTPTPPPSADPPPGAATAAGSPAASVDCPHCGTPNDAAALFCEGCGYDFTTGQAPPASPVAEAAPTEAATAAPSGWVVVVEVDPVWYDLRGELSEQPCPAPTSSTVTLTGTSALIGRTSQSRQIFPEIALDGDSGVSRRHAQLARVADGGWTVVDLGSANGTYVVAAGAAPTADQPAIDVGIPAPIGDKDSIYVGAWSKLTLRDGGA